ncbi:Uncharacterised protein [Burkholderia cepacia]|uniref:Uncharacterized protein n=2 Tax=Burkholderia cepacia TaxID=292 RepID=A0AAE8N9L1_BURCE|nr:Uncharacterised protein [Burkholderia cepacia]
MTRATWMKFIAGALLFGAWLGLVLARLAPPAALVDAIGYALVGLGIYHAASDDGNLVLKFLAGLFLFVAWFVLVGRGLAKPEGLIDAIGYTLAGLGVYQAKGIPSFSAKVVEGMSSVTLTGFGAAAGGGGGGAAMPVAAAVASPEAAPTADSAPAAPAAGAEAAPAAAPAAAGQPAPVQ